VVVLVEVMRAWRVVVVGEARERSAGDL